MNALAILLSLLLGGALQAILPAASWLGGAVAPVLAGLVVHYALTRSPGAIFFAAIIAGIVQDALGLVPLGYSSTVFCIVGWLIHRWRSEVFIGSSLTHAIFGATTASGVCLLQAFLLAAGEGMHPGWASVALKTAGALLLGAICVPWICSLARRLDDALGLSTGGTSR